MSPCRSVWTWASMRPGRIVESPRSMICASEGADVPTDSILFPRTTTTPGAVTLPRPLMTRAALTAMSRGSAPSAVVARRAKTMRKRFIDSILATCVFVSRSTSAGRTSTPPASSITRRTCASSAWPRRSCTARAACRTGMFEAEAAWRRRVHVESDFHVPVVLDDLLVVEAWFGRIGTTSIHIDFEVRRKEQPDLVVAGGKDIVVAGKKGEFAPTPVPQTLREKLAAYVEEG